MPLRHPKYGGHLLREDDCAYVWNIPEGQRCAWVKQTPHCRTKSYISYVELLFCTVGSKYMAVFLPAVSALFVWILYLFLILGTTADSFFIPNLSMVSSVLYISDSIAGVTILAFGNGAPDVFTSIVSNEEERLIMFVELIGAGIFVTTLIIGSVVLIAHPFKIEPGKLMRDAIFYLVAVIWIRIIILDDTITFYESISCMCIYLFFVLSVIITQKIEDRHESGRKRIPMVLDPDVLRAFVDNRNLDERTVQPRLPRRSRAFSRQAKIDIAILHELMLKEYQIEKEEKIEQDALSHRPQGLFSEFIYDITPLYMDDYRKANKIIKFILIVRIPFVFLLQLCIPTVNPTSVNFGWSRLLNCIQLAGTPLIILSVLRMWDIKIKGTPLWMILFAVSITFAIIVFLVTKTHNRPKYHSALAFVGFLKAMLIVYCAAQEVMAVLQCLGYASAISDAMLGITLLAWGNSIGDLVSNVAIAKKGYALMGMSACFGGPLFNSLIGLGLSFTVSSLNATEGRAKIRIGSLAPGALAFLMMSIFVSIIYLNCTAFIARKSYGYLLYTIYAIFLLINLLSELKIIHPMGTDHRP